MARGAQAGVGATHRERRPVIEARDLVKRYGTLTAVDHLSLVVYEGEIFGLLGPNGAGKTTTILMLLGLTEPTEGSAQVLGFDSTRDPLPVKRRAGYLPENVGFYEDLSGRENLRYTAALNSIAQAEAEERIKEVLEIVGLTAAADRKAGTYSRGMSQRLGIADVLVKKPSMIIMDEPTVGIDPEGTQQMLELTLRLSREEGITILLSSHLLHQVQAICDRVGIFVRGRLVALGRVEELGAQILAGEPYLIEVGAAPDEGLEELLRSVPAVEAVEKDTVYLVARCRGDARHELAERVIASGRRLEHLRLRGWSLDDIYLRYFREEEERDARAVARPA